MKTVLVTGGCGFIASTFCKLLLSTGRYIVVNVDRLDECSNLKNISKSYNFETGKAEDTDLSRYHFYCGDINNAGLISKLLQDHQVNVVYHFAAQSHVDKSFGNATKFVIDNVLGTSNLLECARDYLEQYPGQLEKFIHVSTDEVYGEITGEKRDLVLKYGLYDPTNPYAASKAAAEMMVKSYEKSYRLPVIITRSNNVYGPGQYWEKIIPKFIYLLSQDQKCTVYGDGQAMRKYLYIDDAAQAYLCILEKGKLGHIYEMDSDTELTAMQTTQMLISAVKPEDRDHPEKWIDHVEDRHFHDIRYIVNPETLHQLGWHQEIDFQTGLARTVEWYLNYAIPRSHWTTFDKVCYEPKFDHSMTVIDNSHSI